MNPNDKENIDFVHGALQCLMAPPSQVIYKFLLEEGPKPVADIKVKLNKELRNTRYREGKGKEQGTPNARIISSSSTSQFLRLMKKYGIVCFKPDGKKNIHFINPESTRFLKKISTVYEEHKNLLNNIHPGPDGLRYSIPDVQEDPV